MSTKIDKKSTHPDIAVSVIVPAYNASEYLDQCLDSIQGQSLKNFEVIVVNDASTDNSEEIIQKFVSDDKRFKLLWHRAAPCSLEHIVPRHGALHHSSGSLLSSCRCIRRFWWSGHRSGNTPARG